MSARGLWRKPWLWLPAKVAHDLSPFFLYTRTLVSSPATYKWRAFEWRGLRFANRLGIAGGVDKNAECLRAWWTFGCGFIEIGTVTPKPQAANPGVIMSRDASRSALWNKMGFPSAGVERVVRNLVSLARPYYTPVFVNIGKNRDTANENAANDYVTCVRELYDVADAFVINISSPNTAGLRELLKPENLRSFLQTIIGARDACQFEKHAVRKPLLLKLSPDLDDADFENALQLSLDLNLDGWIISNTTLARDEGMNFPREGGVSGAPLAPIAKTALKRAVTFLGPRRGDRLLISAGGVMNAEDVRERLELGADLVQVYTALIFEGPGFFKKVARAFQN